MAIIGLTDQQAAFPIIGVLRKGEEKTGNRPGKDLDYFRFTSEDIDALETFQGAYPAEPRQVNIFLPHKTTDENMDSWMEQWVAGGLVHRCNGRVITLWRTDSGEYSTDPKPCSGGCKQVGRLSVIVPELGRFATVTVLTTSIHDIINLTRQLRSYEAINGDLRGIPFVITRRPQKISTPSGKNGKRARREKWLLSIETKPEWTRLQLSAMQQEALPELPENIIEAPGYDILDLPATIIPPMDDTPKPLKELDQQQFFERVDRVLKIPRGAAGNMLLHYFKLVNGNGYEPAQAETYWQKLSETGVPFWQFLVKVSDLVLLYKDDKMKVLQWFVDNEAVYSQDDEEALFDKINAHATKAADAAAQ